MALNTNATVVGGCRPNVVGSASFVVGWARVCSNGKLSGSGGCPGGCFQIVIEKWGGVVLTTGPKTLLSLLYLSFSSHLALTNCCVPGLGACRPSWWALGGYTDVVQGG